ncbi:MAG: MBL fold metallo-hydrolase [Gammaproteobacteria bacterium]|jgi:glyoxylase-like metal-dependent hydrolase (beta-lactamase superfamily II)|nr:MBL fold metallo-hydrolase [Gammaproteobacteria bacterium]MBT6042642.1 MBL fold metallo-hydrolase [Gammaproteobacteria bacterium]
MQIGDIEIDRIVEMEIPFLSPADAFPGAPVDLINTHRDWLEPAALCPETGMLIIAIQTWIIRTPQHLILVDTCIGCNKTNHYFENWHQRSDNRWYQSLLDKGIDPAQVDYVFCTHLHGDHCGWNTRLVDGRWVPTFPNAKYIIAKDEIDHVAGENTPAYQESVLPCIESGQVLSVATDYALDDHVWLEPALGHTPGHVAVHLQSRGQRAVLCGDLIHSPLQCLYPHWEYWIDHNPQQAISTRKKFLETQCEQQNLVLTAHFPSPSVGHVTARNDTFWFEFIQSKI